jgi:hypothetical protein
MIDDATEATTIRPLTEGELDAVAGGFSLDQYLQGVVEVVAGIKDVVASQGAGAVASQGAGLVVTGINDIIASFRYV